MRRLWDISIRSPLRETSQRHLRGISKKTSFLGRLWDISNTSRKRRLSCDSFETSQMHVKKDVFFETFLRRLEYISKIRLLREIFETSRIHLKKDVFYVTSWRCLKFISKKMYYRSRSESMSPGEGWEECPKIVTNDDIVTFSHYFSVPLSPLNWWHPFLMVPKIHIFWHEFEIADNSGRTLKWWRHHCLFVKVVLHSSYDILFYETWFFKWTISQKYDFKKTPQVRIKSRSKVMPVSIFYLWLPRTFI